MTDNEICPICASDKRDHSTIMVVENTRDLMAYEKTGKYEGVYHVLHGAISPMLGKMCIRDRNKVDMNELIKAALRSRPDRIIVGEVRAEEALSMLNAMNTGHDGSISTGHANSSKDMLKRIETMVLMGVDMPVEAIRGQKMCIRDSIKAALPEVKVSVDASCCAGVTPESHRNALEAMKMCQIGIV